MGENKFWMYDSSGNKQEIQGAYVRDSSGNPWAISEIYMRDANGVPHKVFPTGDDPTDTSIMQDNWFTFCGIEGSRVTHIAFQSNSVVTPPSMPTVGQGLSNSIWHFNAYGHGSDTWIPYGRHRWTSTPGESSGDNPLDGLDWGYFGTVTRRVPKVTSTTVMPAEYVHRAWIRPSTVKHLSLNWEFENKAVWWKDTEDLPFGDSFDNSLKTLNVPRLFDSVDYYEYKSQGNRGQGGPFSNTVYSDCCFNTSDSISKYDMRSFDGGSSFFSKPLRFETQSLAYPAIGTYSTKTPAIPMTSYGDGAAQGKWVVIEQYNKTELVSLKGENFCSSVTNDFPCNKTAFGTFDSEKEVIVAYVANKQPSGASYNFVTDYQFASEGASFWDMDTDAGDTETRWHTYTGRDSVFLFIRYRTSAFSQNHTNSSGNPVAFEPELKEFWINPSVWARVSNGGSWSSNYIGMVMETIPTVYTDPCLRSDLGQAHLNLPKYFYWNIPLRQCAEGTISSPIIGFTYLPNTSNQWAWGTPTPFHEWDNTTGRQDLLGAGATAGSWSGFDPEDTASSHPNSAESGYEFDLMGSNKNVSSMDGFPYGVGHAYGSDVLAPGPWCACSIHDPHFDGGQSSDTPDGVPRPPTGSLACPCTSEFNGSSLQVPNRSNKCSSAVAQQTVIYLLDKTNEDTPGIWDHTTWSSGVPENIVWDNCSLVTDGICGGQGSPCGDLDCPNCINAVGLENCNCAACCECVRLKDPYCAANPWDGTCMALMEDPTECRADCADNPDCLGW